MVGSGLVSSSVVVVVAAWSKSIRKNVVVVVAIKRSGCCFCVRVEWVGGYISDLVSDGGATGRGWWGTSIGLVGVGHGKFAVHLSWWGCDECGWEVRSGGAIWVGGRRR